MKGERNDRLARGLGWFSIGLGATQLLAPRRLGRLIGVGDRRGVMRALGLREVATGVVLLAQPRSGAGRWARVAGDLMDVSLLARAAASHRTNRGRIGGAIGLVAAIGVLDAFSARQAMVP